jgi:hypothetical protein
VNFNLISSGAPFGSLPVDPVNQTSSGLFYAYNTNGSQFQVTANLESSKYKSNYATNVQTSLFPEVISGGTPGVSALYNPSGLVGYWPLNEGTGTAALDQSGNSYGGTWTGSLVGNSHYGAGKVGSYAGDFDGSSDYITTVSSLPTLSTFTFTAWVNLSSSPSRGFILWLSPGDMEIQSGYLVFNRTGCGQVIATPSAAITTGAWYFVAATWNGSTGSLYVNGSFLTSGAGCSGFTTIGGTTAEVGGLNASDYFPGLIDEARIYNRALSAGEIAALYHAQK